MGVPEPAALVRGIYDDFAAGALRAPDPRFDERFRFVAAGRTGEAERPLELDGLPAFVEFCDVQLARTEGSWVPRPTALLVDVDGGREGRCHVAALVTVDARRGGERRRVELVHVWTLQDGQALRCHSFVDDQRAYERLNAAAPPARRPAPPVLRAGPVHHVGLTVSDLASAAAWFQRVLGLVPAGPAELAPDGRSRRVRLQVPAGAAGLGLVEHLDPARGPFREQRPGLDHLSFAVPAGELDRWAAHLDACGVPRSVVVDSAVVPGARVLVLRGPDGLQLELFGLQASL